MAPLGIKFDVAGNVKGRFTATKIRSKLLGCRYKSFPEQRNCVTLRYRLIRPFS